MTSNTNFLCLNTNIFNEILKYIFMATLGLTESLKNDLHMWTRKITRTYKWKHLHASTGIQINEVCCWACWTNRETKPVAMIFWCVVDIDVNPLAKIMCGTYKEI